MYKVVSQRTFVRFSELLNQVWGLEGCLQNSPLRTNRYVRFGFGGSTVLLGWGEDQVSFNTTVGGCLFNLMIKAFFSSFHFPVRAKSLAFFAFTKLLIKNSNLIFISSIDISFALCPIDALITPVNACVITNASSGLNRMA